MISREEVAKKLREAARTFDKEYPNGAKDWLDENAAFDTVDEIIGTDDSAQYEPFFNRLADLIDPTCRIAYIDESWSSPDVGHIDEWHYECSRCCYELNDEEMDEFEGGALPFRYCPDCGARVVRDEA